MPRRKTKGPPPPGGGLIAEDHSDIKIVPAEDREWWSHLPTEARIRVADRYRKRWTDEETRRIVTADPDTTDYYALGEQMGRTPGALRWRRALMTHLLKDEYGWTAKAELYIADPKKHHKYADAGQLYRILKDLGWLDRPVSEQFALGRHLQQPKPGWRGDNTGAVLRDKRDRAVALRIRVGVALNRGGRADGA